MKMTARPSAANSAAGRFLRVFLLPGDDEAIAGRQRHRLGDLLHVLIDVTGRAALGVGVERNAPLQILPLDDLRARALDDLGDLAQRHHAQLAVRSALVGRQVEIADIGRELAAFPGQLHVDLVILPVGSEPVAHRLAGQQRAHRRAHLLHRDAEVGGDVVVEPDRQRGIGGLLRCLQVRDAGDLGDFLRKLGDELLQRVRIGPEQIDPDRPVVAQRELDARDRPQRRAYGALEILLRAATRCPDRSVSG